MEDEVKKEETQKNTRQCVETIVPSNSSDDVDGTAAGTSQVRNDCASVEASNALEKSHAKSPH